MAKYVIAVKYSGRMNGEFFMNIDNDGAWWTTEDVNNAQAFGNWGVAADMYRQIEDKAARLGIFLCIIKIG